MEEQAKWGWALVSDPAYQEGQREENRRIRAMVDDAALASREPDMEEQAIDLPPIGAYVLATKYSDGDPGDAWALGFYDGVRDDQGRHYVKNSKGEQIRGNGYRRVRAIRPDVGRWLLEVAAPHLERCPPGTVNLWTMLTDRAFDLGEDAIRSGLPSSPAT